MTRKLYRLPIIFLIIIAAGLLASGFIIFIGKPLAEYPPKCTFKFLPISSNGVQYILASPGAQYRRGAFAEFFLGKHYRFLWTTPVKVPVLVLGNSRMKVAKKGGGMQTTSFTLRRSDGKEFLLRSVDKDTKAVLPPFLQNTLATSFVRDQISATDPYALLVVAELSRYVGIYQREPEMVYILPNDPAFKDFSNVHGFYMLFPKDLPGLKIKPEECFLYSLSTPEFQALTKKPRPTIKLDTLTFLECRLFDLLISDWDRHPGQWDWLAFSNKKDTIFRPAPKDRDQALGYYHDGILPWLLTSPFAVRKITSFTHEYKDMQGALQNGSVLDKAILRTLPPREFTAAAKHLKSKLTNELIAQALKKYPSEIRNKMAPLAYSKLISRRNKLEEAAIEFYDVLHQE